MQRKITLEYLKITLIILEVTGKETSKMKVICCLLNSIPANDNIGYLKAYFVESKGLWESADEGNVPQTGEILILSRYSDLEKRFDKNELFIINAEANAPSRGKKRDCRFVGDEKSASPLSDFTDFNQVIGSNIILTPNGNREVESRFKPETIIYLKHPSLDDGDCISGPFQTTNPFFDESNGVWSFKIGTVAGQLPNLPPLDPFCAFSVSTEQVPNFSLVPSDDPQLSLGIKLGFGLNALNLPPLNLMSNSAAISALDGILTRNSKLGRKGKREFVNQIKSTRELRPLQKERIIEILNEAEENEKEVIERLLEALEAVGHSTVQTGARKGGDEEDEIAELKEKLATATDSIKQLKSDNELLSDSRNNVERERNELTEKLRSFESGKQAAEIAELKTENSQLKQQIETSEDVSRLSESKQKLQRDVSKLELKEEGLRETLSSLETNLGASVSQFRTKVLEVVPFFEILNTAKNTTQPAISSPDIVLEKPENPVVFLSDRLQKTGYQASTNYLHSVCSAVLTNKFTSFFSVTGSGKTTLAKLLAENISGSDGLHTFIPVARGWSSPEDFVGSNNPFTEKFDFQNDFWRRYTEDQDISHEHLATVVFDEATLSPIEHYFTGFLNTDNQPKSDSDQIMIGGTSFTIPGDMRFLFTFNFDNSTEEVTERFIDRNAIIPPPNANNMTETIGQISRNNSVSGLDASFISDFVEANKDKATDGSSLHDKMGDIEDIWREILGDDFRISPRKRLQIDAYLQMMNISDDDEYACDFASVAFLVPQIRSHGLEYEEKLKELAQKIGKSRTQNAILRILKDGRENKIFRHL